MESSPSLLTAATWHNRPPTPAQRRRADLDVEVRACFDASGGTYGSPRVRAELRRRGRKVSKKTVEASMARQGLAGPCAQAAQGTDPPRQAGRAGAGPAAAGLHRRGRRREVGRGLQAGRHRRGAGVPRHRGGSVLQADAGLRAIRPPLHRGAGHSRGQHGRRGARRRRGRGDLPCPAICPWTPTGDSPKRSKPPPIASPRTRCCWPEPSGCASASSSTSSWTASTRLVATAPD